MDQVHWIVGQKRLVLGPFYEVDQKIAVVIRAVDVFAVLTKLSAFPIVWCVVAAVSFAIQMLHPKAVLVKPVRRQLVGASSKISQMPLSGDGGGIAR